MTNGEKIKEIFPNGVLTSGGNNSYYWGDDILVSKSWWNAEYKEPTTKNDKVDCEHTDCNNCVNHKYCDYEPTTKNNLGVDCVARQDVERYIEGFINEYTPKEELECINLELDGLKHIPSVTPLSSELEKNSKKLEKDFGELDCISRADAIKAIQDKAKKITNEDTINGLCGAVAILYDLPSVTPIRPKGHWIEYSWNDNGFARWGLKCDKCLKKYKYGGEMWGHPCFCPNCGADMREVEE